MAKKKQTTETSEAVKEEVRETKKMYWTSPTMIPGIGVVQGEVEPEHKKIFTGLVSAETAKRFFIGYDPAARKLKENRAKFKKKIGLRD